MLICRATEQPSATYYIAVFPSSLICYRHYIILEAYFKLLVVVVLDQRRSFPPLFKSAPSLVFQGPPILCRHILLYSSLPSGQITIKKSEVFDTSNKSYEPFQVDDGDVSAGYFGPNSTHFMVLSKYLFINTSPPRHSFLSPHEPHSSRGQIRCGFLAAVLLLNTCFRVVVNWYFVARALRGYRDSHHGPIEDICALAVVIRVLL